MASRLRIGAAFAIAVTLAGCGTLAVPGTEPVAPRIDYHQHLVSPAFEPIVKLPARDGAALVAQMDAARIERAVVLSVGYSFADERKNLSDPDRLTREENDWTSAQVTANAPRLVGFCSANPLRDAALAELERCLRLPGMLGIKLHLGNSGVSLRQPAHLERVAQVAALGQRLRAPILFHLRARGGLDYGAEDARIFIAHVLPAAGDVDVVVAHFGGSGPGYPPQADEVMQEFAAAVTRADKRMAHVYFDVATIVAAETTSAQAQSIAQRIGEVGIDRILYGSDLNPPGGSIRAGWEIFAAKVPLTGAQLRRLAGNEARFIRAGALARRGDIH